MINDVHHILCDFDVVPPVSRTKIELALIQDEEVGDGTTSVMILASELLVYAKPLFNSHLTIIVEDFNMLLPISFEMKPRNSTLRSLLEEVYLNLNIHLQ
ncbi:hypothetical protein GEMRC1_000361 [Eukaryota sp. GEM-RC1]